MNIYSFFYPETKTIIDDITKKEIFGKLLKEYKTNKLFNEFMENLKARKII